MQEQINLGQISDIKELKAMAYDQISTKHMAEENLNAINGRIVEIMNTEKAVADADAAAKAAVEEKPTV